MKATFGESFARPLVGVICLLAGTLFGGCGRSPLEIARVEGGDGGAWGGPRDAASVGDGLPNAPSGPVLPMEGQCAPGLTACGKGDGLRCYDVTRSKDHCGACGTVCAAGLSCESGKCRQYQCKEGLSFKKVPFGDTAWPSMLNDFDGDGHLDLLLVAERGFSSGSATIAHGAGDGTFGVGVVIPLSAYQGALAKAADLDGDGVLDLVAPGDPRNRSSPAGTSPPANDAPLVLFWPGTKRRDVPFVVSTGFGTSGVLAGLLLSDLDADGYSELVVTLDKGLTYWRGKAGSLFGSQTALPSSASFETFSSSPFPQAIDWNGDGVLDLVYASGAIRYQLGRGDGTFDAEVACALGAGVIGDIDHNRRPDMVTRASVLLGLEDCHADRINSLPDWPKQANAALADFNGDGHVDLVGDDNKNLAFRVGDGKGGFSKVLSLSSGATEDSSVGSFLVGDLNHDGKMDLVYSREPGPIAFVNTCK